MKAMLRSLTVAVAILASLAQQASAAGRPDDSPVLLGTTGACNNVKKGGPCTRTSTLVQLDPNTGQLIKTIGPVGYTVNGLAWDRRSGKLYASTAVGDAVFHGVITIDPRTGAGTPVEGSVVNFGLPVDAGTLGSPIHSITIDSLGHMVGWYDEFPPPVGVSDTFVRIDKRTGVATEFPNTGIDTSANGLSFGAFNILWNIDTPRRQLDGSTTQTAYVLNPFNGKSITSRLLSPPTMAALGDFNPENHLYYGVNFESFSPTPTFIVVVDVFRGTVTTLGQTVDDLHVIAFVQRD